MNIEKKAIKLVMAFERRNGRKPKDVSKERCGYDIKSSNRLIEVKGRRSSQPGHIYLYKKIVRKSKKTRSNYYIYQVFDIKKSPKLCILLPKRISKQLEPAPLYLIRAKAFTKLKMIKL